MPRRIAFLVGKQPRPGTIVAEVVAELEAGGISCRVWLPHDEEVGPGDIADADLVVHRGLSRRVDDLIAALAAADERLCNPWPATLRVRDRAELHRVLEGDGVPSPGAVLRETWAEALADAASRPVVVKLVSGSGRGKGVLTGELPASAPAEAPFLVEDLIHNDGTDRKLYVAGSWVAGLLKPSTLVGEHTTRGEPFRVDGPLGDLARRAAAAAGLHLAGVDMVLGRDGPVVVDVNPFPGYRGVAGAARAVACHLVDHLP